MNRSLFSFPRSWRSATVRLSLTVSVALAVAHAQGCTLPAPTGVRTTPRCSAVLVNWNQVSFAVRYMVYRTPGPSFSGLINLGESRTTSFVDSTALAGTTYYYWLQTWCTTGSGGTTQTGVPGTANSAPPTPTGVSASDGSSCADVVVSWSHVASATGYRIFRSTGTTMPSSPLATVGASPYSDTTAVAGTTHRYWVQSVNACNPNSPQGNAAGGPDTGRRALALAAPSGAAASDGSSCNSVRITWNTVTGATGYEVWRNGALLVANALSPYDDFNAQPGIVCQYAVAARSATSGCSSALSATNSGYRASVPPAPTDVVAGAGATCGTIRLAWNTASGANA